MTNETTDFFLWASHGENVSSKSNFYPIETKFNSVIFYSKPFKPATGNEIAELFHNPCRFILGTCPQIPTYLDNNKDKKKHVFLPPLFFFSNHNETSPDVLQYSGLYYFKLKMNNYNTSPTASILPDLDFTKSCQIVPSSNVRNKPRWAPIGVQQILDHQAIVRIFGSGEKITYSQIYKLVIDQCNKKNIPVQNITLGIFSCQTREPKYIPKYTHTISNLIPKREELLNEAKIFSEEELDIMFDDNYYLSPTTITYNKQLKNWTTIAGIKYQGCGLNVLSFYDILEENYAREKTVCLNIQGTSIFRIVDYINDFLNKQNINWPGFVILRTDINQGVKLILNFMENWKQTQFAIIFKMYEDVYIPNKKEFSQLGHSVSFYKNSNGVIYFIDPQQEINQEINVNNMNTYGQELQNKYGKNFIDIILTVSAENFPTERPSESVGDFFTNYKENKQKGVYEILTRPNIHYGGKRIMKSKKNKQTKKRMNKKSKKHNTMKKRMNSKRKRYGGQPTDENELDEFEKLMLEIDRKNNIPTVLDNLTVVDL